MVAVRTRQGPCAFGRAELILLVLASTDFSCSQLSEDTVVGKGIFKIILVSSFGSYT